ncbi:uncharacterized protein MEPE_05379 [Melanopsichium pennsylvanicum]|uniref:Autophagy-related protein 16 domain-containing protein n=2 Tax=Melanopsichium pennsylvanicum TaxID=63383 RepID=A0AAJ5C793_9BASI|nr:conserved hypothetical protein [Melanopsichium pennsylvanicum 4]SNX86670.1 uncharacterized protein MEPE_05379 [Melanopsichium pennsylvanicum]
MAVHASTASSWHQAIYLRLQERDALEKQHDDLIGHYRKLAHQTRVLKQRNMAFLSAATSSHASASGDTTGSPDRSSSSSAGGAPNAVQAAYIRSLEQQLNSLRQEVTTLYKTQGQNAQRLLLMSESHREKEQEAHHQSEALAKLQLEYEKLKRQADDLGHALGEKDKGIQILQDELTTLSLELSQIEARNENLKKDNANLLQRWLDRMNEEADKMNDGTMWLEEVRKRRQSSANPEAFNPDEKQDTSSA